MTKRSEQKIANWFVASLQIGGLRLLISGVVDFMLEVF